MGAQSDLDFDAGAGGDGYSRWLAGRRMAAKEVAQRMHLPLDHKVEVWLVGGVRLRGVLRLHGEMLFVEEDRVRHLQLQVGAVAFSIREMESCVRIDDGPGPPAG